MNCIELIDDLSIHSNFLTCGDTNSDLYHLENSRSKWDFFFISIEKNQDKDTNIFGKPIIHMPCV